MWPKLFCRACKARSRSCFLVLRFLHKAVERWLLLFGILFILVVFFFPKGILGTVKDYQNRLRASRREKVSEHSVRAASLFRRSHS